MNIANVRMGTCSLMLNGVDCGHTLGGVKVTITRKLTPLKVDKYGDSPVDQVLTDVQMVAACKIAEPVVAIMKEVMPEGDFESGTFSSRLGIAAGEGAAMRQYAQPLVLHPLANSASNQTEDVTIYLAVPTVSPVINYEVANQKVFDAEFTALVSEIVPGRRLGHIGSPNIS